MRVSVWIQINIWVLCDLSGKCAIFIASPAMGLPGPAMAAQRSPPKGRTVYYGLAVLIVCVFVGHLDKTQVNAAATPTTTSTTHSRTETQTSSEQPLHQRQEKPQQQQAQLQSKQPYLDISHMVANNNKHGKRILPSYSFYILHINMYDMLDCIRRTPYKFFQHRLIFH